MAFSFVIEDGTGRADANSFVSVEEASDVLSENITQSDLWDALEPGEQERALAFATRTLNSAVNWKGRKATAEQSLAWPRTGVVDGDGYDVAPLVVPREVRAATAYLARHLLKNDPSGIESLSRLDRVRVDVIDISFRDDSIGQPQQIPSFVRDLIAGLGMATSAHRWSRIARA